MHALRYTTRPTCTTVRVLTYTTLNHVTIRHIGYNGTLCDVDYDECLSNPCQHGARCLNNRNHYECLCSLSYDGTNCQKERDFCFDNAC